MMMHPTLFLWMLVLMSFLFALPYIAGSFADILLRLLIRSDRSELAQKYRDYTWSFTTITSGRLISASILQTVQMAANKHYQDMLKTHELHSEDPSLYPDIFQARREMIIAYRRLLALKADDLDHAKEILASPDELKPTMQKAGVKNA